MTKSGPVGFVFVLYCFKNWWIYDFGILQDVTMFTWYLTHQHFSTSTLVEWFYGVEVVAFRVVFLVRKGWIASPVLVWQDVCCIAPFRALFFSSSFFFFFLVGQFLIKLFDLGLWVFLYIDCEFHLTYICVKFWQCLKGKDKGFLPVGYVLS